MSTVVAAIPNTVKSDWLKPFTVADLMDEQRNAPMSMLVFKHVRERIYGRLEDMQEEAQSDRQARFREESVFEAELLPKTREDIAKLWADREAELLRSRKPHAVPSTIRPIPPLRKAAGA